MAAATSGISAYLRASELFAGLSADALAFLAGHVTEMNVPRGARLIEIGEPGDCLYFVLRGRLRALLPTVDGDKTVGEIGPGETVGEMALLTGSARTVRVIAIRDSMLVRLSREIFQQLTARYPQIMLPISRILVDRLSRTLRKGGDRPARLNLVVLQAGRRNASLTAFCRDLARVLAHHGRASYIESPTGKEAGTRSAAEDAYKHRIAEIEMSHDMLVFEADPALTPWTIEALDNADRILCIADASDTPDLGKVEQAMVNGQIKTLASVELVMLHAQSAPPHDTAAWLAPRFVTRHHHIRIGNPADFARLARMLTGKAIGVAFGGGGARGFAHIGVMRALRELHIPVDAVGGTSIGAIFGGLLACGYDGDAIEDMAYTTMVRHPPQNDYTIPLVSLVRGRRFAMQIKNLFADRRIEDFWLPFFCVSTSLTRAQVQVHRNGSAAQWIMASSSLPGILPPMFIDGEIIVDGCILNNLPADIVQDDIGGRTIAVNLQSSFELTSTETHTMGINGWGLLARKLNPFGMRPQIPTLPTILATASSLSGTQALERARRIADLFLEPPVGEFGVLDWSDWREIGERSYRYARPLLEAWSSKIEIGPT